MIESQGTTLPVFGSLRLRIIRLCELVLEEQGGVLSVVGSILAIFSALVLWAGWPALTILLVPLVYEVALRALLFFCYGQHYRYAVFPFILVDDIACGYSLRPSIDISTITSTYSTNLSFHLELAEFSTS